MNGETIIRRSESLSSVEVNGESVILSIERGMYFGMKDVSGRIWSLLEKPKTVGALCDAIISEYDIDRKTVERDIAELTASLEAKGLVEVED